MWSCHASEPLTCTQQQSAKSKHQCQHQSCSQRDPVPVQQAPSTQPVLPSAAYQRSVQPTAVTIGSSQATPTHAVTSRPHCFCQHLRSTCVYHWLQGNSNGCTGQATVFNSLLVCDNSYLPTRATSSLVLPTSVELDCDYGYWAGPARSLLTPPALHCGVQVLWTQQASGGLDYPDWVVYTECAASYKCGASGQVLWTQASGGLDHPVRSYLGALESGQWSPQPEDWEHQASRGLDYGGLWMSGAASGDQPARGLRASGQLGA